MGGQRDDRKQEVEAEDRLGACVGGGSLTFTFLTNPPGNKDLLHCSAGLCFGPQAPQNLVFTISLLLLQRRKWAWRVRETPRGQRGHKGVGVFCFFKFKGN